MNILIVSKKLYPPIGGAELSMLAIAKRLSNIHKVSMLVHGDGDIEGPQNIKVRGIDAAVPMVRGQWIVRFFENLKWQRLVRRVLEESKPDIVLTQLEFAAPTILAANDLNIRTVLFIRSFEFFCLRDYEARVHCNGKCPYCLEGWKEKVQLFFAQRLYVLLKKAFNEATEVVANSRFMAEKCLEYFSRETEIVYPIGWEEDLLIEKKRQRTPRGKYITMISPMVHKGVDIFLEIARYLPQENFLAVGRTSSSVHKKLSRIKNVTYVPWTENKADVFRKTKLLLVPSLWEEAFGRVCLEAIYSGIPCIVSNRGGLPEAVGPGGVIVDDFENASAWIKQIEIILSSPGLQNKLIVDGQKHIKNFESEKSFNKLLNIINKHETK